MFVAAAGGLSVQQKDTDTCCLDNSTTLHSFYDVCMSSLFCGACDVSVLFVLSPPHFCQHLSFSLPSRRRRHRRHRRVLAQRGLAWSVLCSGSPRGGGGKAGGVAGAASRSPRVKGENSENRAFWSAGEDLPAPFCMLGFGRREARGCV